jgi:hypothetical protein
MQYLTIAFTAITGGGYLAAATAITHHHAAIFIQTVLCQLYRRSPAGHLDDYFRLFRRQLCLQYFDVSRETFNSNFF